MPVFTTEDFEALAIACAEAPSASSELGQKCIDAAANVGSVSDGYHTFDELYDHRITLFIALCFQIHVWSQLDSTTNVLDPWRSKLHSDGSAIDGWFVMGIGSRPGEQITYHLPLDRWTETDFVPELERAPEWDKHTSADVIARLKALYR